MKRQIVWRGKEQGRVSLNERKLRAIQKSAPNTPPKKLDAYQVIRNFWLKRVQESFFFFFLGRYSCLSPDNIHFVRVNLWRETKSCPRHQSEHSSMEGGVGKVFFNKFGTVILLEDWRFSAITYWNPFWHPLYAHWRQGMRLLKSCTWFSLMLI